MVLKAESPVPHALEIRPPRGWTLERLGDLGEFSTSSVNKKDSPQESPVRLINYMDVYRHNFIDGNLQLMEVTAPDSQLERSQVRVGDILFTPSSETPEDIGHSAVVRSELPQTLHSYHTVRLRPNGRGCLDIEFSGWVANAPYVLRQFSRLATGSTRYTLSLKDFREVAVLLPPLTEQRKIAAIFSSVDDAIAATRKVIEQTRRVKQGLLQTLMTRGIGHTQFKKTEIGEIPEAWEVVVGKNVFSLFGGQKPASLNDPDVYGEFLYLKVGDFNTPGNQFGLKEAELTFDALGAQEVRIHGPGAIIFPKRGAAIFQDRVQILKKPGTVDPNLMVMESRGPIPDFLRLYLITFGLSKVSDNSGVPQINNKHLYPMKIPLPPRTEQERIAEVAGSLEESERQSHRELTELQVLKHGLMQDLLTGRVRVQPD